MPVPWSGRVPLCVLQKKLRGLRADYIESTSSALLSSNLSFSLTHTSLKIWSVNEYIPFMTNLRSAN